MFIHQRVHLACGDLFSDSCFLSIVVFQSTNGLDCPQRLEDDYGEGNVIGGKSGGDIRGVLE